MFYHRASEFITTFASLADRQFFFKSVVQLLRISYGQDGLPAGIKTTLTPKALWVNQVYNP